MLLPVLRGNQLLMTTAFIGAIGVFLPTDEARAAPARAVTAATASAPPGAPPTQIPTVDEVLDNFSLYWLTNTATSGARLYWENRDQNLISAAAQKTREIKIPVAITASRYDDLFRAPESWARQAFPTLIYFNEAPRGGQFPAWEEPQLFSEELRKAFRSVR